MGQPGEVEWGTGRMSEATNDRGTEPEPAAPAAIGYATSLIAAAIGIAYALVMCGLVATGRFTLPPPGWAQLFAGVVTIVIAPLLVAVMAAFHYTIPAGRRLFSLLGVVFSSAFMVMVCINRFVQLGVVRLSALHGDTGGLERFLPYGTRSATLALEMVGWGFFLGLAFLSVACALSRKGLEGHLRRAFLLYAVLGIISTVAYVADSPLSSVGFIAWGVVLPLAVALLAAWFRRQQVGPPPRRQ